MRGLMQLQGSPDFSVIQQPPSSYRWALPQVRVGVV